MVTGLGNEVDGVGEACVFSGIRKAFSSLEMWEPIQCLQAEIAFPSQNLMVVT